jgi:hypothetical protein
MAAKYKFLSEGVTYRVCSRLGENWIGLNRSVGSGSLKAEGGGAVSFDSEWDSTELGSIFFEKGNQDLRLGGIVQ